MSTRWKLDLFFFCKNRWPCKLRSRLQLEAHFLLHLMAVIWCNILFLNYSLLLLLINYHLFIAGASHWHNLTRWILIVFDLRNLHNGFFFSSFIAALLEKLALHLCFALPTLLLGSVWGLWQLKLLLFLWPTAVTFLLFMLILLAIWLLIKIKSISHFDAFWSELYLLIHAISSWLALCGSLCWMKAGIFKHLEIADSWFFSQWFLKQRRPRHKMGMIWSFGYILVNIIIVMKFIAIILSNDWWLNIFSIDRVLANFRLLGAGIFSIPFDRMIWATVRLLLLRNAGLTLEHRGAKLKRVKLTFMLRSLKSSRFCNDHGTPYLFKEG